jgi:hypothetical protein
MSMNETIDPQLREIQSPMAKDFEVILDPSAGAGRSRRLHHGDGRGV